VNNFQIINASGSDLFTHSSTDLKLKMDMEQRLSEGQGHPKQFSEILNSDEKKRKISPKTEDLAEVDDEGNKSQHVVDDNKDAPFIPIPGEGFGNTIQKTEISDKNLSSGGEMTSVMEGVELELKNIPLKTGGITKTGAAQMESSTEQLSQSLLSIKPEMMTDVMEGAELENIPLKASEITKTDAAQMEISPEQPSQSLLRIKPEMMTKETEKVSKALEEISAEFLRKEKDALQGMGSKFGGEMDDGGGQLKNTAMLHASLLQSSEGVDGVHTKGASFHSMLENGIAAPDKGEILRQVADQIRTWRPGKSEPLRFLLEPRHLGTLKIDLLLQEKGVTAHIVTADPLVKELLEGNQSFLRQGLESQGLHVDQFSVDLGGRKGFLDGKRDGNSYKREQRDTSLRTHVKLPETLSSGLYRGSSRVSLYV